VAGTPTGLVLALLGEFASDMRESKSINQLALSCGKAYANVHAAATQLINENILIKETVGHSHRCRLNLSNDKTLLYISLLQTLKRDELLRNDPSVGTLLYALDDHSVRSGILLAWRRDNDLLLITTQGTAPPAIGIPTTVLPLAAFLNDHALRATIGKHTLLFGHALYASLLRESPRRMEVQR
jgi:hypothetical protein